MLIPGSFSGQISGSAFQQLQDFSYYSFTTLTTLGYGDIALVRETARALATLEAIVGQFNIATLVAGLVAAYITRTQQTTDGES
ncbi:MAG: potassium channel family protein [Gammaproteobacteria bacterium]